MTKIRTTMQPTVEIDVGDAELRDLTLQGLVLTGTQATTDTGLEAAALRQIDNSDGNVEKDED